MDGNPGSLQGGDQVPGHPQAVDLRLPAAAIEPDDQLTEGPLGPSGVKVGNAERNPGRGLGGGHFRQLRGRKRLFTRLVVTAVGRTYTAHDDRRFPKRIVP
jgi:hypothetical protein